MAMENQLGNKQGITIEVADQLNEILKKLRVNNKDEEAFKALEAIATNSLEGQYWLGVHYFCQKQLPDNYQRAKEIFTQLAKAGFKHSQFWLGLLNYPLFALKKDLVEGVELWQEAATTDNYCRYWLAQYYLNEEYGGADYYKAWDNLKELAGKDKGAMELLVYLMFTEEFSFTEYDEDAELNSIDYWLDKIKVLKYPSPYGEDGLVGEDLINYPKAYVNDHYGNKFPLEIPSPDEEEEERAELAMPSPYRGISFIIGGIFLLVFVILTFIHVWQ